jgi:hypothetical protein
VTDLAPPADLSEAERGIWAETIREIEDAGTLFRLNLPSLRAYVSAVKGNREAAEILSRTSSVINRGGKAAVNPALSALDQTARVIERFAKSFRLTAARPGFPEPAASPVRDDQSMRPAGAWFCEQHHKWHGSCHKKGGDQCHGQLVKGLSTCRMHVGGASAKQLAAKLVREPTYGSPVKISSEDARVQELWRTAGHVRWLADRVAELEYEVLTFGTTREIEETGDRQGTSRVREAKPHLLLDLYQRERKHLVYVSAQIISAGLADRLVRVAEAQGAAMARIVQSILDDLELSPEQLSRVPAIVPRRFRELMPAAS